METKTTKCIINPAVARKLLREGNPIIDIKANKNQKDRTVFVFENTEKFSEDFRKMSSKEHTNGETAVVGAFDPSFFQSDGNNMSEL